MRKFDVQTDHDTRRALSLSAGTRDYFNLFDSPSELADHFAAHCMTHASAKESGSWVGGDTAQTAMKKARNGDVAGVEASNRLLERFERFAFEAERKRWTDDVCGGFPNVPAFLSGHPLAMRRRIVDRDAAAPIAVIVDLCTSASVSADQIRRRGAAILALVRILAMRRPVELWAGTMMNTSEGKHCISTFCRIETAPLDVATAAYVLTSASYPRVLCYGVQRPTINGMGNWPYAQAARHRDHMARILAPGFTHATETLCLPAMFGGDEASDRPEQWIEAQLARLAPAQLEAAE